MENNLFAFIVIALGAVPVSYIYVRYLLQGSARPLIKFLSALGIVLLLYVIHFIMSRMLVDNLELKADIIGGFTLGSILGAMIFIMRYLSPERELEKPSQHAEFIEAVNDYFKSQKISYQSRAELEKNLITHYDSIKFWYVERSGKPFICKNIQNFISEVVRDMTRK